MCSILYTALYILYYIVHLYTLCSFYTLPRAFYIVHCIHCILLALKYTLPHAFLILNVLYILYSTVYFVLLYTIHCLAHSLLCIVYIVCTTSYFTYMCTYIAQFEVQRVIRCKINSMNHSVGNFQVRL